MFNKKKDRPTPQYELHLSGFDADYYATQNPDVKDVGEDLLGHFLHTGWKEGRNPSAHFSVRGYLERNPEVVGSGINPLVHFLETGMARGLNGWQIAGQDQSVSTLDVKTSQIEASKEVHLDLEYAKRLVEISYEAVAQAPASNETVAYYSKRLLEDVGSFGDLLREATQSIRRAHDRRSLKEQSNVLSRVSMELKKKISDENLKGPVFNKSEFVEEKSNHFRNKISESLNNELFLTSELRQSSQKTRFLAEEREEISLKDCKERTLSFFSGVERRQREMIESYTSR